MNNLEKGRTGEASARDHLIKNGYTVICRNFHAEHGEIDIIAENETYIVFVEVKFRFANSTLEKYGRPACAVDYFKRKHFVSAAKAYLSKYRPAKRPRIDVIEITADDRSAPGAVICDINRIESAFGVNGR